MRGRRYRKKSIIAMTSRMIVGIIILLVLYGCWAICWPKVMGYMTAHKNRNVPTEMYNNRFADMNPVQLEAAKRYGITPIDDRKFDFANCRQLTRIEDCEAYSIDNLTHSVPYLIPAAAALLKEIGEEFQASLKKEELTNCRIVVTSVLRTREDIHRLANVNVNASENSAHCYGTTFDLSYFRFQTCGWISWNVYDDQFVEILADVLTEKRKEGLCYVRFETKQHCFHITSRR